MNRQLLFSSTCVRGRVHAHGDFLGWVLGLDTVNAQVILHCTTSYWHSTAVITSETAIRERALKELIT
jgi:hypothetical protein